MHSLKSLPAQLHAEGALLCGCFSLRTIEAAGAPSARRLEVERLWGPSCAESHALGQFCLPFAPDKPYTRLSPEVITLPLAKVHHNGTCSHSALCLLLTCSTRAGVCHLPHRGDRRAHLWLLPALPAGLPGGRKCAALPAHALPAVGAPLLPPLLPGAPSPLGTPFGALLSRSLACPWGACWQARWLELDRVPGLSTGSGVNGAERPGDAGGCDKPRGPLCQRAVVAALPPNFLNTCLGCGCCEHLRGLRVLEALFCRGTLADTA